MSVSSCVTREITTEVTQEFAMPRNPSLASLRATLQRLNLQQKQEIYALAR